MSKTITYTINNLMALLVGLVVLLVAGQSSAWTRANLKTVEVNLDVQTEGMGRLTTEATFNVEGGRFHGFDLARSNGRSIDPAACSATTETGKRFNVTIKTLFDGRTRVVLEKGAYVNRGLVHFILVHNENLVETGALRKIGDQAMLNWTPLVWDHGTERMSVTVSLPNGVKRMTLDKDVVADYEVVPINGTTVKLIKQPTFKWYPMQVAATFDATAMTLSQFPADNQAVGTTRHRGGAASGINEGGMAKPWFVTWASAMVALLGVLLMWAKSRQVWRAHRSLGRTPRFWLLRHTSTSARLAISTTCVIIGLGAQWRGSVAASIAPMAVAVAVWLFERRNQMIKPRVGGTWRAMDEDEELMFKRLYSRYRRARRSILDVTSFGGAITFAAALVVLGIGVTMLTAHWSYQAFAVGVNGLIFALPVWFSFTESELPKDPTAESFSMIRKWRRELQRLVGRLAPQATASYWVREDELGPIEVRLRVSPVPTDLTGIEVAAEVIEVGGHYRVRQAAILKMVPGTETARHLATCENAVEHHLSPDLAHEIIVLRNRRGHRERGMAALKSALAFLEHFH